MNNPIKLEEKNYADCISVNLDTYKIKNFKTKSFLIYRLEYKDDILYAKKPFKKISVDVASIQYFAIMTIPKNYSMYIMMITNDLYIHLFISSSKIGCDYLILNLLKHNIPQITYASAYEYIQSSKLKKFSMD